MYLAEHSPEFDPVLVGEEHHLPVHTAIHHVMDATVDIDALPSPGHARIMTKGGDGMGQTNSVTALPVTELV